MFGDVSAAKTFQITSTEVMGPVRRDDGVRQRRPNEKVLARVA
jgi:hypothetical protein